MTSEKQRNIDMYEKLCAIKALVSVAKRDLSRCVQEMESISLQMVLPSGEDVSGELIENLTDLIGIIELAETQVLKAGETTQEIINLEL